MSKNFPLRRLPGKVVQQQTPSPKSRNFGQSYQRSDGYSYTLKQIPTRLTVYRRDASTLRPLTDRRKQHLRYAITFVWIIGHGAHAQSSRAALCLRHSISGLYSDRECFALESLVLYIQPFENRSVRLLVSYSTTLGGTR